MVEKVVAYWTVDGKRFDDKCQAAEYEKAQYQIQRLIDLFDTLLNSGSSGTINAYGRRLMATLIHEHWKKIDDILSIY